MSLYNGTEFNAEKGSQGSLLKYIWLKINDKFKDFTGDITTAVASEATARANAINEVTAKIAGLKKITPWDATQAFPTQRVDGEQFEAGNYVQITVSNGEYKAGDFLICKADVVGNATVENFGDIDKNTDVATSIIYGTVKLVADLASYQGIGNDSAVITKVLLKEILTDLSATITTAYQDADSTLSDTITTAYETAISTALADYYSKAQVDNLLLGKTNKADSASIVAGLKDLYASIAVLQSKIPVVLPIHKITTSFPGLAVADTMQATATSIFNVASVITQQGIELRITHKNAEPVADWAAVTHPDKDLLDAICYRSLTTGFEQILFNPEYVTYNDVVNCRLVASFYIPVPTLEQQLGAPMIAPVNPMAIGKADGSSSASLTALEAKFSNINVNI